MSATVQIQLDPEAQRYIAGLKEQPLRILKATAAGMSVANKLAVSNIQAKHLTGVGPFPVELHRLGKVSSLLLHSVRDTEPQITGAGIASAIGSNVKYAAIHEVGGVIHHEARTGKVRLATDKGGKLIRQPGFDHLAVFASADNPSAREVTSEHPAYDINMPAREPFITGVREMAGTYQTEISKRIIAALKN